MASSYDTLYDLCRDYYNIMSPGEVQSQSIEVHGEILTLHLYRLNDNFVFDSEETVVNTFSLCTEVDTYTQVLLGKNMTVNEGVILTPPFRCKGLVIFDKGTFTNNSTVSMTARGCKAAGQNIYLFKNKDGTYEFVPAFGSEAPPAARPSGSYYLEGIVGNAGVLRGTGSGGNGALATNQNNGSSNSYCGRGSAGTSYSGGAGAGSAQRMNASAISSSVTSSTFPRGGNGYTHATASDQGNTCFGGAGVELGSNSSTYSSIVSAVSSAGAGGLLILFCFSFNNKGHIVSNGNDGPYGYVNLSGRKYCGVASGAGSGGGSINVFYFNLNSKGILSALGGNTYQCTVTNTGQHFMYNLKGGPGGAGSITLQQILYSALISVDKNLVLTYNNGWERL